MSEYTYTYKFSQDSKIELSNIYDYISTSLSNPMAANNLMNAIYDAIDLLRTFPTSAPIIPEEPYSSMGYRKLLVKNYFVIYSVDETAETINILHIIYAKSDYLNYL